MKTRPYKVWCAPLLLACGAALLLLSLAAIALLVWLRPAATGWQQSLQLGAFTLQVSTGKVLRLAAHHPIALLLDGRGVRTSAGIWRISAAQKETILTCEPCVLAHPSLGPGRVRLDRVSASLKPDGDGYSGLVRLRAGADELAFAWRGIIDPHHAIIDITAAGVAMANVIAVLGHELPESRIATISGSLSMQLRLHLPERRLQTQWTLEQFHVTGLGTEKLLNAALPAQCGSLSGRAISGWLPSAVIAAEDQTFRSHPGYDTRQIDAALRANGADNSLRGASTLTQQLARLLYTGDERTPQRKLRELLYAVEMEQTLGKARILQLYLALAPWGQGQCGAEHAAQRYLGKSASALSPAEAAWLASLLTNPDAQLRQMRISGVDGARTAHIVEQMRPMSARRRTATLAAIATLRPQAGGEPAEPVAPETAAGFASP